MLLPANVYPINWLKLDRLYIYHLLPKTKQPLYISKDAPKCPYLPSYAAKFQTHANHNVAAQPLFAEKCKLCCDVYGVPQAKCSHYVNIMLLVLTMWVVSGWVQGGDCHVVRFLDVDWPRFRIFRGATTIAISASNTMLNNRSIEIIDIYTIPISSLRFPYIRLEIPGRVGAKYTFANAYMPNHNKHWSLVFNVLNHANIPLTCYFQPEAFDLGRHRH